MGHRCRYGGGQAQNTNTAGPVEWSRISGYENDVFQVEGGPEDRDGYVWWFLVNPYDSSISGWAVENYLRRMENP
ncbi:MAG: hypothetical protein P8Z41_16945 [Anaerolineales bacterium]